MNKLSQSNLTILILTTLVLIGVVTACTPQQLSQETEAANSNQDASITLTLESMIWQLESYTDAHGNVHPALTSTPVTITFNDGKFIGDTHCNGISGKYTLDGAKVTVQIGPNTLRACEPDIISQENGMTYSISHAVSYKINNGKLTMMDANGNTLLTFIEQQSTERNGNN